MHIRRRDVIRSGMWVLSSVVGRLPASPNQCRFAATSTYPASRKLDSRLRDRQDRRCDEQRSRRHCEADPTARTHADRAAEWDACDRCVGGRLLRERYVGAWVGVATSSWRGIETSEAVLTLNKASSVPMLYLDVDGVVAKEEGGGSVTEARSNGQADGRTPKL